MLKENTCETCLSRQMCKKTIGFLFGFCNVDYKPDTELINFTNCILEDMENSTEAPYETTLEDAAITIKAWKADGVDVPNGFTPEFFCKIAAGFIK